MKALSITLALALTMMTTVSQAELRVAKCGRIYNDTSVTRSNEKGVLNASNIASVQKLHKSSLGQAGAVSTDN